MNERTISGSAFNRILTLYNQEIVAAERMRDDGSYSDFFVDSTKGPPWHEAFTDVIVGDSLSDSVLVNSQNASLRMRALRRLNVIQAYSRMRQTQSSTTGG